MSALPPPRLRHTPLITALALALPYGALHAQTPTPPTATLTPVVISATPLRQSVDDSTHSAIVLDGDALQLRQDATLGAALDGLAGIHSNAYGAGASRPVIRGQESPRVKVLADGSELLDASEISPDHLITTEPLLAQRVEVLRGPATLLYGGGAIGGVVNVLDGRIPTQRPDGVVDGEVHLRADTASRGRAGAFGLTTAVGENLVLRAEGAARRSRDYRAPGLDTSRVPGTFNDTHTGSLGLSWVTAQGYTGIAYTRQHAEYGLPGHSHEYESCHPHGTHLHCGGHDHGHGHGHGHSHRTSDATLDSAFTRLAARADDHDHDHDHEHGHDDAHGHDDDHGHGHDDGHDHDHDHDHDHLAQVNMTSHRWELRSEYDDPAPGVRRIRARAAVTRYRHGEWDGDTEVSSFHNRGHDVRVELEHQPLGPLEGMVGVSSRRSDFRTAGTEAFMPRTDTRNHALFLVEQYRTGDWLLQGGARYEHQRITVDSNTPDYSRGGASVSAAATWTFADPYSLTLSFAHATRQPNAQELYSRGVHLATNTYELGNADLGRERSRNLDLTLRKAAGDTTFAVTLFHNEIDGFIYAETLDRYEDFRLIQYTQANARFTGLEGRVTHRFSPHLSASLYGDTVRGRLRDGDNLPRIPGARVGAELQAQWGPWSGGLDLSRVLAQDDYAAYESRTAGYTLLGAQVRYSGKLDDGTRYTLYLRGSNLLDQVVVSHASFLGKLAPAPGRHAVLGVRVAF